MPRVFTREQVERYHVRRALPGPRLSRVEWSRSARATSTSKPRLGGKPSAQQLSQTHLYFRWAYGPRDPPGGPRRGRGHPGAEHPVWTVSIFPKARARPRYTPGTRTGTYWRLSSTQVTTAWVALTDSTVEERLHAGGEGLARAPDPSPTSRPGPRTIC